MFSIIQPLFLQKTKTIQFPNIYLGLGFEFGPQRIRDLTFVYVSVVRGNGYRCECESGYYGQRCHNRCPRKGARISGRFGKLLGILVDCI